MGTIEYHPPPKYRETSFQQKKKKKGFRRGGDDGGIFLEGEEEREKFELVEKKGYLYSRNKLGKYTYMNEWMKQRYR